VSNPASSTKGVEPSVGVEEIGADLRILILGSSWEGETQELLEKSSQVDEERKADENTERT